MQRNAARPKSRSIISRPLGTPEPDHDDPRSADYTERHRVTETTLPNGMVRVDVGEPLA